MIRIPAQRRKAPQLQNAPQRVQAMVLEYADVLQKLCNSLAAGSGEQDLLEQQILEARASLVLARAALLRERVEQKRARHVAMHDNTTALPNGRFLLERLELALADARPPRQALAVLHINIGSDGHDCDESLLKIVAARLNRSVRAEDMVFRLGGDEFACLLPGLPSHERLAQLACMLSDVVSARLTIGSVEIRPRANIGIAVFPDDGATADALLESADAAMCFARRRQTRFAFFDGGTAVRATISPHRHPATHRAPSIL